MASIVPEQVPLNQLARFSKAGVGDLFINEQNGGKVLLMSVTAIEDDVPLTLERAKPMIEGYLRNSRNKQATEEYLRQAKATAHISYLVGDEKEPMQISPEPGTQARSELNQVSASGGTQAQVPDAASAAPTTDTAIRADSNKLADRVN
jgi:hypothetical protein